MDTCGSEPTLSECFFFFVCTCVIMIFCAVLLVQLYTISKKKKKDQNLCTNQIFGIFNMESMLHINCIFFESSERVAPFPLSFHFVNNVKKRKLPSAANKLI